MTKGKFDKSRYWYAAAIIIVVGVSAVGGALGAYYHFLGRGIDISQSSDEWEHFGAFFSGFAGTIVALGTLIAVAITFHVQAKELAESRELLTRQAFDSTFFQLLRRFSEHVSSLRDDNGITSGREVIERYHRIIQSSYERLIGNPAYKGGDATRAAYDLLYATVEGPLGVYFRTLYHVFKLVDRRPLGYEERIDYANIARAQLSAYELCLLFYNCMAGEGAKGFKPLVEKYGILKHLNAQLLADPTCADDPTLYARSAFMSQSEREAVAKISS